MAKKNRKDKEARDLIGTPLGSIEIDSKITENSFFKWVKGRLYKNNKPE